MDQIIYPEYKTGSPCGALGPSTIPCTSKCRLYPRRSCSLTHEFGQNYSFSKAVGTRIRNRGQIILLAPWQAAKHVGKPRHAAGPPTAPGSANMILKGPKDLYPSIDFAGHCNHTSKIRYLIIYPSHCPKMGPRQECDSRSVCFYFGQLDFLLHQGFLP